MDIKKIVNAALTATQTIGTSASEAKVAGDTKNGATQMVYSAMRMAYLDHGILPVDFRAMVCEAGGISHKVYDPAQGKMVKQNEDGPALHGTVSSIFSQTVTYFAKTGALELDTINEVRKYLAPEKDDVGELWKKFAKLDSAQQKVFIAGITKDAETV